MIELGHEKMGTACSTIANCRCNKNNNNLRRLASCLQDNSIMKHAITDECIESCHMWRSYLTHTCSEDLVCCDVTELYAMQIIRKNIYMQRYTEVSSADNFIKCNERFTWQRKRERERKLPCFNARTSSFALDVTIIDLRIYICENEMWIARFKINVVYVRARVCETKFLNLIQIE